MAVADDSGRPLPIFKSDWKIKRKFYKTEFSFDKFETPRRIATTDVANMTVAHATIAEDMPEGILDTADHSFPAKLSDLVFPVTAYIIPL